MKPLIWIIDEEWPDYEIEKRLLREAFPDCTLKFSGYDYREDLESFGKNAHAILSQIYTAISKDVIDELTNCKIIAVYGGGYDRVDYPYAKTKGILVTNVQGYCAEDLADYVMSAIFHTRKNLTGFEGSIQKGLWGAMAMEKQPRRISSAVLLIIGFGTIGRAIAVKANALSMRVLAYDPYVDEQEMAKHGVTKAEWKEGLREADFISVSPIYRKETHGLLSYADFQAMKRSAVLINTSRGNVIVEEDLVRAVKEGLISGAIVDVIAAEPPTGQEEILHCPGILVTPHISYISEESFTDLKEKAVTNVIKTLSGQLPNDIVNK